MGEGEGRINTMARARTESKPPHRVGGTWRTGLNSAKYQTQYVQRGESTAAGGLTCEEDNSHNDAGVESPRKNKPGRKKGPTKKCTHHACERKRSAGVHAYTHTGLDILSRAGEGRNSGRRGKINFPLLRSNGSINVSIDLAHHVLWLGPREVLVPHVRLVQPVQVPRVGRLGLRAHAVQAARKTK